MFLVGLSLTFVSSVCSPHDLFLYVTSRLLYSKVCRALHACHTFLWRRLGILWVS